MSAELTALADGNIPQPTTEDARVLTVPDGFNMRPVDGQVVGSAQVFHQQVAAKAASTLPSTSNDPDPPRVETETFVAGSLGVLEKFVGTFEGTGFNRIFRPRSKFPRHTFETALELNLTHETLTFMDKNILGDIPNRGFSDQGNVLLKGIPYTQIVSDLLNEKTGNADRKKGISIHFEQGLFLRTPPTDNPRVEATIARLASIPHGTTINAQCKEPTLPQKGKPSFPEAPIKVMGLVDPLFDNPEVRVPANIDDFRRTGTIPLELENNPNKMLADANEKRTIHSHYKFTVSTKATDDLPGGGTSNIAFLMGQKPRDLREQPIEGKGNAVVSETTCTYWVSTVFSDVIIKAGDYDKKPATVDVVPEEGKTGLPVPMFRVNLNKKVSADTKVMLPWTQIQYSQNVILDFSTLRWPHISIATLVPSQGNPLVVEADSPLLSMLK